MLNKVSTRLSTNTAKRRSLERNAGAASAATGGGEEGGAASPLRIGADRHKSDSLRKGRKRRSNDRSQHSTLVSPVPVT